MPPSFAISEDLAVFSRARLGTRPIPGFASFKAFEDWRWACFRTKSPGHGDLAFGFDPQELYDRLLPIAIAQATPSKDANKITDSCLREIRTTGVSGPAFIDMFINTTYAAAPEQIPPPQILSLGAQEDGRVPDFAFSVQIESTPTPKYTAEQRAERKALKKERRVQQKMEVGVGPIKPPSPSRSPPPAPSKLRSRRARSSPSPTKTWQLLSRQIQVKQAVAPTIQRSSSALAPTRSSSALRDARSIDDEGLTGPDVVVLWPSCLTLLIILWLIISAFRAPGKVALDLEQQSTDLALLVESEIVGVSHQNSTIGTYQLLRGANSVFFS